MEAIQQNFHTPNFSIKLFFIKFFQFLIVLVFFSLITFRIRIHHLLIFNLVRLFSHLYAHPLLF